MDIDIDIDMKLHDVAQRRTKCRTSYDVEGRRRTSYDVAWRCITLYDILQRRTMSNDDIVRHCTTLVTLHKVVGRRVMSCNVVRLATTSNNVFEFDYATVGGATGA